VLIIMLWLPGSQRIGISTADAHLDTFLALSDPTDALMPRRSFPACSKRKKAGLLSQQEKGNPAVPEGPAAFRPHLAMGLAIMGKK
jgi:hypothetical protein